MIAQLFTPALSGPTTRATTSRNKLAFRDRSIHDWYRFVPCFPAHLVRHYLDAFGADSESVVLDPFSGTGTVVVECKKRGITSLGTEAHPMAHFAATVKTTWAIDPNKLVEHATRIQRRAAQILSADQLPDAAASEGSRIEPTVLRSLSED